MGPEKFHFRVTAPFFCPKFLRRLLLLFLSAVGGMPAEEAGEEERGMELVQYQHHQHKSAVCDSVYIVEIPRLCPINRFPDNVKRSRDKLCSNSVAVSVLKIKSILAECFVELNERSLFIICALFNGAVSNTEFIPSDGRMIRGG
jgi:hypothetical protein